MLVSSGATQGAAHLPKLGEVRIHLNDGLESGKVVVIVLLKESKTTADFCGTDLSSFELSGLLPSLTPFLLVFRNFLLVSRKNLSACRNCFIGPLAALFDGRRFLAAVALGNDDKVDGGSFPLATTMADTPVGPWSGRH